MGRGFNINYSTDIIDTHFIIEADDFPTYDLYPRFFDIYNFMEEQRNYTNILVHCC